MSGYFLLHKKILNWEWFSDPKSVALWIYILANTNYAESVYRGHTIRRGQAAIGRKRASMVTGLSQQEIRTRLKRFETNKQITTKSTTNFSIVTVLNYDQYQSFRKTKEPQKYSETNKQITTSKEVKKERSIKEVDQNETNFDLFWSEYPRKVAKKKAKQIWMRQKLGNGTFPKIMDSLRKVKKTEQWEEVRLIPHPATWLNQERWEDEIATGKLIDCKRCKYYRGGSCNNLKKPGFDVSNCGAFTSIEDLRKIQ
jgi:hypothetical protein